MGSFETAPGVATLVRQFEESRKASDASDSSTSEVAAGRSCEWRARCELRRVPAAAARSCKPWALQVICRVQLSRASDAAAYARRRTPQQATSVALSACLPFPGVAGGRRGCPGAAVLHCLWLQKLALLGCECRLGGAGALGRAMAAPGGKTRQRQRGVCHSCACDTLALRACAQTRRARTRAATRTARRARHGGRLRCAAARHGHAAPRRGRRGRGPAPGRAERPAGRHAADRRGAAEPGPRVLGPHLVLAGQEQDQDQDQP